MSMIKSPSLGPIVGHTTPNSCRLWIRGSDPADRDGELAEDRRTIGVITVLKNNGKPNSGDPKSTSYFRLHREYDRTGTFNLGVDTGLNIKGDPFVLNPNTSYRVRMGTLVLDDPFANDESVSDKEITRRLPSPSIWAEELMKLPVDESEAEFQTSSEEITDDLSFLIGSCRYPGLFWKKKHSDRIFSSMLDHVKHNPNGKNPRFVLMVGDQIYADMFHRIVPIGRADTAKEFHQRYHEAFGSLNMRRLLRNVTTYMILDDHEIEDNWTQDRIDDCNKRVLFFHAMDAYMSYQWSHGPRNYEERLFYQYEYNGFPFFVLDQRTQRYKDDAPGLEDNHLLGRPSLNPENEPTQLDHLCNWLSEQNHKRGKRPKFIVSPSVFVPNTVISTKSSCHKGKSDSWPAFPETRKKLLNHIVSERIQNVVFLSGDIHCSNVAEIEIKDDRSREEVLKAFSITSSAFYWPFWFADGEPSNYVHDSKKQNDTFVIDKSKGIKVDYIARSFTQKDNFCQVDIDWPNKQIEVRAIDKNGDQIKEGNQIIKSTLKLA